MFAARLTSTGLFEMHAHTHTTGSFGYTVELYEAAKCSDPNLTTSMTGPFPICLLTGEGFFNLTSASSRTITSLPLSLPSGPLDWKSPAEIQTLIWGWTWHLTDWHPTSCLYVIQRVCLIFFLTASLSQTEVCVWVSSEVEWSIVITQRRVAELRWAVLFAQVPNNVSLCTKPVPHRLDTF